MTTRKRSILLSFFTVLFPILLCFSEPTESSLLSTWEIMQRNHPKILIFEKAEEDVYKFKTDPFPYEGHLKIANVTIDERMAGSSLWYSSYG